MWREWRICLGEMEIWDGLGGGGRRGVWMDLWYYLVSNKLFEREGSSMAATDPMECICNNWTSRTMREFISFPSFDCPRQTTPTVCSTAKHNTKFVVSLQVTATVFTTHVRSTWDVIVLFQNTPKVVQAASSKTLDLCVEPHDFTPQNGQIYEVWLWLPKKSLNHQPTSDGMIFTGVHKPQAPARHGNLLFF